MPEVVSSSQQFFQILKAARFNKVAVGSEFVRKPDERGTC